MLRRGRLAVLSLDGVGRSMMRCANVLPAPQAGRVTAAIERLLAKLRSSTFSRNVSVMLTGTVLGQIVSVALSPLLTRIYHPVDFATLSVYTSLLNIFVGLAALRYEIPLSTAADDDAAANLLAICTTLLATTTVVLSAIMALVPQAWLDQVGIGDLPHCRLLLVLGFVLLGSYYVLLYTATRSQDFKTIARTRISQGISGPVSQIGLGLAGAGVVGLTIGFVIGQSSGTMLMLRRTAAAMRGQFHRVSLRGMAQQAWRHRGFPLISSWANLIDTAGAGQVVYILIAALYPGSVAGYMFLAERVVARPLLMLSTSLLTVFMGEIGKTLTTDTELLRRRFMQVSGRQLQIGLVWIILADAGALIAFPLVFGRSWAEAVPYLVTLSFTYLVTSVIGSVAYTLQVLGKQAVAAVWQVSRVVAIVLCFVLSARGHLSALTAIMLYTGLQIVACGILFCMMRWYLGRTEHHAPPSGAAS